MGGSRASSKVKNVLKDPGLVSFFFAILSGLAFHHDFKLTVLALTLSFHSTAYQTGKKRIEGKRALFT